MSDNTNLVPVNLDQLPSTQIGSDDQFADLAKSADYIGRLQLFTKGKAINKKLVGPGNYGIPESRRGSDRPGRHHRHHSAGPPAEGHRHDRQRGDHRQLRSRRPTSSSGSPRSRSKRKATACTAPASSSYERSTGRFLEFFCGSKSSRSEAKKVYPYLPLSQADIDAKAAKGEDVGDLAPHGPLPLTLKSRLVEKGTYSWHVPVVVKCATPFEKLPPMQRIVKEITAFLTVKDNGVERAAPVQSSRAASPRRPFAPRRTCRKAPAGFSTHPLHRSLPRR